jgi:hypothetical protein
MVDAIGNELPLDAGMIWRLETDETALRFLLRKFNLLEAISAG